MPGSARVPAASVPMRKWPSCQPNMRIRKDCPRERSNVTVELEMDGKQLYHVVLPPTGLVEGWGCFTLQAFARASWHASFCGTPER